MPPPFYQAYLLRLWHQQVKGQPAWRISLENVHTGERIYLNDLNALLEFLETHLKPVDRREEGS